MNGKRARMFRQITRMISKGVPWVEYCRIPQEINTLKRIDRAVKYGLQGPDIGEKKQIEHYPKSGKFLYLSMKNRYKGNNERRRYDAATYEL
jgi:hypothetical protein